MQVTEFMIVGFNGSENVGTVHVSPERAKVLLLCPDAECGTVWATWEGNKKHVFVGVNELVQELMDDLTTGLAQ